ncbi:MAG: RNA polymerase sigma factor [Victivallales bacterium]|nr:RNA polymerase sigma factor [Victivallales bacterium]
MILINTISEAQFDAVVSGHIAFFRKVALRILKNWQDADDAVQNALLKGWRRRLFLRRRDRLPQWLCSIVINESYNILRARRNDEKRRFIAHDNAALPQTYEYNEQLSRLDAAIANLPEIYRETVHVALLSGIETEAVASLLGCSTNTLYQRIHKAKQLLREALKDE